MTMLQAQAAQLNQAPAAGPRDAHAALRQLMLAAQQAQGALQAQAPAAGAQAAALQHQQAQAAAATAAAAALQQQQAALQAVHAQQAAQVQQLAAAAGAQAARHGSTHALLQQMLQQNAQQLAALNGSQAGALQALLGAAQGPGNGGQPNNAAAAAAAGPNVAAAQAPGGPAQVPPALPPRRHPLPLHELPPHPEVNAAVEEQVVMGDGANGGPRVQVQLELPQHWDYSVPMPRSSKWPGHCFEVHACFAEPTGGLGLLPQKGVPCHVHRASCLQAAC